MISKVFSLYSISSCNFDPLMSNRFYSGEIFEDKLELKAALNFHRKVVEV
jgi:hypothetical protein